MLLCDNTNKLHEFRISKYDSKYRINEDFLKEDWTSISDVGKIFNGEELTYSEYEQTENRYLKLIEEICSVLKLNQIMITDIEDCWGVCKYHNSEIVTSVEQIIDIVKDCLREKYWCKLSAENFYIHFGYDYYLYVGSSLDIQFMNQLALNIGLFVETKKSPYNMVTD